jgi:hypothetical protein
MLFDFSPQQIEDLATNGEDIIKDDEEKPLLAFVVAATWVLQTLAQHCEEGNVWIPLVNEVTDHRSHRPRIPTPFSAQRTLTIAALCVCVCVCVCCRSPRSCGSEPPHRRRSRPTAHTVHALSTASMHSSHCGVCAT